MKTKEEFPIITAMIDKELERITNVCVFIMLSVPTLIGVGYALIEKF